MSKFVIRASASALAMGIASAYGAGFALYEGSAAGVAMGGAVMGKAVDGSAVFYNPATMSDFTNTVVTVGFVTEHPTADVSINSSSARKMDPGFFVLPHAYVVQPLPADFAFGLGFAPEFGLGSHYHQSWPMSWDTQQTTIMGLTISPNVSYKITDDWTIAAGLRLMYVSFDQISHRQATTDGYDREFGRVRDHLKGDNHFLDWGWEISTKYDITEKLHFGAMYRSYVDAKLKGYNHTRVERLDDDAVTGYATAAAQQAVAAQGLPWAALPQAMQQQFISQAKTKVVDGIRKAANAQDGHASAKVRLPASATVGLNYDVNDDIEIGTSLIWTQWSTIKHIKFNFPSQDEDLYLGWKDTYRLGTGVAWRFAEDWKWMNSYIYDMDPCRKRYGSTMLPAGDRHILATGLSWNFAENWELSGVFGYVVMCEKSLRKRDALGTEYKFDTHKGRAMAFGLTLSYRF